jgi:sugar phosphate isomerase/epimerase
MARLALHTWTLDTTPLTAVLRVIRSTGWDAIELRRVDFARASAAGDSADVVLDRVKRSGLPVACVGVELGWMFAEGDERRRLLGVFAESCRWARELGASLVMSPVDRVRGSVARAAESAREVGDIAGSAGVRLALEFNSQVEQFNSLQSVREVVAKAAHPSVGLLLDTYHLGRTGPLASALADVTPDEIAYVQYSDVPKSGLEPGKALDRLPPGQGCVPLREMFGTILKKGYAGYLSYEAPNPSAWSRPAEDVAREALAATRAVL